MKIQISIALALLLPINNAFAEGQYKVSITNITLGQIFTPQFVATHDHSVSLFSFGAPASSSLGILAESGDTAPLTAEAQSVPNNVGHVLTIAGLLEPGKTATTEISASDGHHYLTVAAMLIPTNDTFVALAGMKLPDEGSVSYIARAYDAGTEENDQNCAHIPGPRCGGEAISVASDTDEGFIYVSNGFQDLGSEDAEGNEILGPKVYDWRNPVAQITITRMDDN